jgi:O-antigen ligase
MGPFLYHNQYAAFIELLVPLGLWLAMDTRRRAWLLMTAWMVASVVVSNSRAGFALVIAELAAVELLTRGKGARQVAGLAVAAVALLFVVGWEPLVNKYARSRPYQDRMMLLESTIEMARERPWTGFGLGTWQTVYPAYAKFDDGLFDNQAHNDWAQWAAEGGVATLGCMMWFAAMLVRPALRSVWGIGLLSVLAHCWVEYHFQQRPAFGYFYFALAGALLSEYGKSEPVRGNTAKDS